MFQTGNDTLRSLAVADQDDRKNWLRATDAQKRAMSERDALRRRKARTLLDDGGAQTGEDLEAAALIFQHGDTPDDYQLAHELAALAAGRGRFGSLPALAEDRFLQKIGRRQRFGSQLVQGRGGRWVAGPTDETGPAAVTDALRADFLVPSLADARRDGLIALQMGDAHMERVARRLDPAWDATMARRPLSEMLAEAVERPSADTRRRVLALYRADKLAAAADYRNAARALAGSDRPQERLLAHELATVALMRRDAAAHGLFMRTWDAYLAAIGRPARYQSPGGAPAPVRRLLEETHAHGDVIDGG